MMGLFKRTRKGYSRLFSREMIMTREQAMKMKVSKALEELMKEERIVTEEEVSEEVAKAIGYKFKKLEETSRKENRHTCSQCGAPLKDCKCEYCGTDYN